MKLKDNIIAILSEPQTKFVTFAQLNSKLKLPPPEKGKLDGLLKQMMSVGEVVYNRQSRRYSLAANSPTIKAVILGSGKGYAFARAENAPKDFYIAARNLNGALHKDEVLISVIAGDAAKVERVVTRGMTEIVGRYDKQRGNSRVISDDYKFDAEVLIPYRKDADAQNGQRVVAKIVSYPRSGMPTGEIVKVLGDGNDLDVQTDCIALNHRLAVEFDKNVENEVGKIAQAVTDEDIDGRLDLRKEIVFTIDGADARDLDDAVSIKTNEDGGWTLGVHIADVSYYVTKNSCVDYSAQERGTSVYFPNKVLPMLPKELSNGICSLNEKVDRLTMSMFIEYDADAVVKKTKCARSVIKSCKRFTYDEVQEVIDGKELKDKQIQSSLQQMIILYQKLKKKRQDRGSIDFNTKELMFEIQNNTVTKVYPRPVLKAHNLIEEFMIAANVEVAKFLTNSKMPCVFRIHDKPDPDKIRDINGLLKSIEQPTVQIGNKLNSLALSKIIAQIKEPYVNVVNTAILRAMQKARYSTVNIGHFGLSEAEYCHFTSPIRRYPDLMVHRLLTQTMERKFKVHFGELEELAELSSINERKAVEAEREVNDLMSCLYAAQLVGQIFDGIISGVTGFGIFVELENGIEGLVKIADLNDRSLTVVAEKYSLVGVKTTYRLGDKISITVDSVDMENKRIRFILAAVQQAKKKTK